MHDRAWPRPVDCARAWSSCGNDSPTADDSTPTCSQSRRLKSWLLRPLLDPADVALIGPRDRAEIDAGGGRSLRGQVGLFLSADEAGRELADALVEHGEGSWGVHRSNLAVLGPVGDTTHDLAFAAEIGLPCWGIFTIRGKEDTFVIPGAYREL